MLPPPSQIRTCRFPASGSSGHRIADGPRSQQDSPDPCSRIRDSTGLCVDADRPQCVEHLSTWRFMEPPRWAGGFPAPPFPPQGPPGWVPPLHRYYEDAVTTAGHPARSFASLRGTTPASCGFAPAGQRTLRPRAWALFNRPPPVSLGRGDDSASQVPGEPPCAYALFSDPARAEALSAALQRPGAVPARWQVEDPWIAVFEAQ